MAIFLDMHFFGSFRNTAKNSKKWGNFMLRPNDWLKTGNIDDPTYKTSAKKIFQFNIDEYVYTFGLLEEPFDILRRKRISKITAYLMFV